MIGWSGLRAATLGMVPGAEIFRIEHSEVRPPPIVPTVFPPIEPVEPAPTALAPAYFTPAAIARLPQGAARPAAVPIYYAAASSYFDADAPGCLYQCAADAGAAILLAGAGARRMAALAHGRDVDAAAAFDCDRVGAKHSGSA
jgi:hypothetical protein